MEMTPTAIRGAPMFVVATLGLCVNLASAKVLSHGGSKNANVRAAMAHVLADALGSVAAMVAGVLVLAFGWTRADAVVSAVISVPVLWSAVKVVKDATRVLLESAPRGFDLEHRIGCGPRISRVSAASLGATTTDTLVSEEEQRREVAESRKKPTGVNLFGALGLAERVIAEVPGVAGVHDLHVWEIAEGDAVLTVHVVLAEGAHDVEVVSRVGAAVRARLEITHATISSRKRRPARRSCLPRVSCEGEHRTG